MDASTTRLDQDILSLFGAVDTPDEFPASAPVHAPEPAPVPVASPVRVSVPVPEPATAPLPAAFVSPLLPVPAPAPVPDAPHTDALVTDAVAALAGISAAPPAPAPVPAAGAGLDPAEGDKKAEKKHRHHKKDKSGKEVKKKEAHHKHGHGHKHRHHRSSSSESDSASAASSSSASSSSSSSRKRRKHRKHRAHHRRRSDSSSSSSSSPSSEDVDEVAREAEEFKRVADARSRDAKSAAVIFDPARAEKERKAIHAHSTEAKMAVVAEKYARDAAEEATNAEGRPPVRTAARVVHGLVKKITTLQRTDAVLSKRMAEGTYAPGAASAHPHGGGAVDEGSGDDLGSEDSFDAKSAEDSDEGDGSSNGSFIASDEDDLEKAIADARSSAESDDEGRDSTEKKSRKEKRKEKKEAAAKAKAESEAGGAALMLEKLQAPLDMAVLDAEPVGFRDTEMGRLSEHYQVKISSLFAVATSEAEVVSKPESDALARYLRSLKRDAKGLTSFDLNSAHVASSHAYALASLDQHLRTSVVKGLVLAQAQLNIPGFPGKPTLPSNPAQRSFAEEVAGSMATTIEPDTKRLLNTIWDAVREGRESAALLYRDLMNAHSVTLLAIRPMVETPDRQVCPLSGTKIEPGEPVALLQIVRHGPWEEDAPDHDKSWFSARPWEDPSLLTHTGVIIVRATVADKAPPLFVRKQKRQEEAPAPAPGPAPLAVPRAVAPPPPPAPDSELPPAKRARLDPVAVVPPPHAPSPSPLSAPVPMGVIEMPVPAPPPPPVPAARANEAAKRKREGEEPEERAAKRVRTEVGTAGPVAPLAPTFIDHLRIDAGQPRAFDDKFCVELNGLWQALAMARDREIAPPPASASDNPFFDAMDDAPPPASALATSARHFARVETQADLKQALQAASMVQDMNHVMAVVKRLVVPEQPCADAARSSAPAFDFTDLDALVDAAPQERVAVPVYRTLATFNQRLIALLVGIRQRVDKAQATRGAPVETDVDRLVADINSVAALDTLGAHKRGVLAIFLAIFGTALPQ